MGCDGHYEKAIYFLRPNGFTIMKIGAYRGTGAHSAQQGAQAQRQPVCGHSDPFPLL
jgi:hypothetical protein